MHQNFVFIQSIYKFNSLETEKCTYLSIPDYVQLNQQNNKTYDLQYTKSNNNNLSSTHAL